MIVFKATPHQPPSLNQHRSLRGLKKKKNIQVFKCNFCPHLPLSPPPREFQKALNAVTI